MSRGEVWWAQPPRRGRRPYLVLTRDHAIPYLNRVLTIPATRAARGIPTEIAVDEDDGMPKASVLSADNLVLIEHACFQERICTLSPLRMCEVCRAVQIATGCA